MKKRKRRKLDPETKTVPTGDNVLGFDTPSESESDDDESSDDGMDETENSPEDIPVESEMTTAAVDSELSKDEKDSKEINRIRENIDTQTPAPDTSPTNLKVENICN